MRRPTQECIISRSRNSVAARDHLKTRLRAAIRLEWDWRGAALTSRVHDARDDRPHVRPGRLILAAHGGLARGVFRPARVARTLGSVTTAKSVGTIPALPALGAPEPANDKRASDTSRRGSGRAGLRPEPQRGLGAERGRGQPAARTERSKPTDGATGHARLANVRRTTRAAARRRSHRCCRRFGVAGTRGRRPGDLCGRVGQLRDWIPAGVSGPRSTRW